MRRRATRPVPSASDGFLPPPRLALSFVAAGAGRRLAVAGRTTSAKAARVARLAETACGRSGADLARSATRNGRLHGVGVLASALMASCSVSPSLTLANDDGARRERRESRRGSTESESARTSTTSRSGTVTRALPRRRHALALRPAARVRALPIEPPCRSTRAWPWRPGKPLNCDASWTPAVRALADPITSTASPGASTSPTRMSWPPRPPHRRELTRADRETAPCGLRDGPALLVEA